MVAGQVELSGDEAHYALYGANLDWSYFDHPPLVGWLNAIVLYFSQSNFALRVLPILMFAGANLVIYRLAIDLFPESNPWIGFISVAILQSGVLFQITSLAMIPETPLLVFSLLAMLSFWKAIQNNSITQWMFVGLFFGLAGLSKYTAVTLVITALLFVHFSRQWKIIRMPGPWIAFLISFALILPVLYWNAVHDWISFKYQLGHGFHKPEWTAGRFFITQLAQFAVYSPGIYILGFWALISGFRQWHHPGIKLILAFTLPVFILFGWGGGYEESLPHWTSLAWAGLSPLTAHWLMINWKKPWVKTVAWLSGFYSLILILFIHSLLFYPWLSLPEDKNILRDVYGWRDAAEKASSLKKEMAKSPGDKPVTMVNNWSLASHLAWYSYPEPLIVSDTRVDQFDYWYGGPENIQRGIMVVPSYFKHKQNIKTKFHQCEQIDSLAVKHHGHTQVTYYFYECYRYSKN